jgi:tyrosinase
MANGNVDVVNRTREEASDIKHRKRLSTLTPEELAALREGFRAMQEVSDDRGYGHFGSIHGMGNPMFCEHRNQLFAPWHRGYLYFMEQALQDVAPGVTLPWWDYYALGSEIPEAYAEETVDGEHNPLFDAAIVAADGLRGPGWPERTSRDPDPTEQLPTEEDVEDLRTNPRFATFDFFTTQLEQLHNAAHRFVGNTMVDPRFTAWDPLFWSHHCMVDRMWALWQNAHPGANPRAEHLDRGLSYFTDMTVQETLNVTDLGYDYAADEALGSADDGAPATAPLTFDTAALEAPHSTGDIELHGVDQVVPTFEGRIFAGNTDADADTPKDPDKGFVGAFTVFGKFECWGDDESHCREPEHRRKYDRRRVRLSRAKVRVPIDTKLAARHADGGELRLKIVPVLGNNPDYEDIDPAGVLSYERVSIVTYA